MILNILLMTQVIFLKFMEIHLKASLCKTLNIHLLIIPIRRNLGQLFANGDIEISVLNTHHIKVVA